MVRCAQQVRPASCTIGRVARSGRSGISVEPPLDGPACAWRTPRQPDGTRMPRILVWRMADATSSALVDRAFDPILSNRRTDGPHIDPKSRPERPPMPQIDPPAAPNRPHTSPRSTPDRPQASSGSTPDRPRAPKRPQTRPRSTPHRRRPQIDPGPTRLVIGLGAGPSVVRRARHALGSESSHLAADSF